MKKYKDTITDVIITLIVMFIFAIPFLIFGANIITLIFLTVSCFVGICYLVDINQSIAQVARSARIVFIWFLK